MGTDENEESPTGILPTWDSPIRPPQGLTPESSPRFPEAEGGEGSATGRFGRRSRRPDRGGLRTLTSSLGEAKKPNPEKAARLIIGGLTILVGVAAWAVRKRTKREMRRPTKEQSKGMAEPLSTLMLRHADLSGLGPDLIDIIDFGIAAGDYINDGPMLLGPAVDAGVPEDLNPMEEL